MKHWWLLSLIISILPTCIVAQSDPAAQAARRWRRDHERAIVDELVTLLSLPNVASDRDNIQRNAETIAAMMTRRGIATSLVSIPGSNPVVFGELRTPGATRTLVFYAHYDGQPLDAREWATPPFAPVLRNGSLAHGGAVMPMPPHGMPFDPAWRIYARSAGDDKGPIIAMMVALDAIRAAALQTHSHVKFVFEGEEEAGSPHLEQILREHTARFAGDLWFICDSPNHPSGRQQIVFGAPGLARLDLTVYGAAAELHGGHYGNWAPNPALMLAHLLTSMKDVEGRVLVKGFYEGIEPLSDAEQHAIADVPDVDAQLLREFGVGSRVGAPKTLAELITLPVLNIRGLASARVGPEASSVVPTSATASINLAVMKGQDYREMVNRVAAHVRAQGFFLVDPNPSAALRTAHARVATVAARGGGYNASRTPMTLPLSQEVIRPVESARGPAVKLPTMGGAVPLEMIERTLGTRTIVIPIANHDNNQHSFNENLRVQNLWDGIELMAALLTM
jgi:acetylornithine deacetylase/succinyl-diaminopimelate desuccinylase-like protein